MTSRWPYLCTKQWIGHHVCVRTNPVGIELFLYVKASFYSKQFAKLLTTWLKTIYRPCLCTAAMFAYEKNPVGIELFSYVKTSFFSKQFAKLLTTWLKTIYRPFAASHSRATKPPCWRAKAALGREKQRTFPFNLWKPCFSCLSASISLYVIFYLFASHIWGSFFPPKTAEMQGDKDDGREIRWYQWGGSFDGFFFPILTVDG